LPPRATPILLETTTPDPPLTGQAPARIVNLGSTLVLEGRRLFPKLTVKESLLVGAYGVELEAVQAKLAAYQSVFDTH
jgi:ABC-type branched-subunit amino acid transport system ATPase component